jgi:hypothetical protein
VINLYTPAERSIPLSYTDSDTLQSNIHTRYYVAIYTSAVNGQAAFLDETPDSEFIDRMRRTQVFQKDNLPQRLFMQRQFEIMQHPEILDLNKQLDQKKVNGISHSALQKLRRIIHARLQIIKKEGLRLFQRE